MGRGEGEEGGREGEEEKEEEAEEEGEGMMVEKGQKKMPTCSSQSRGHATSQIM